MLKILGKYTSAIFCSVSFAFVRNGKIRDIAIIWNEMLNTLFPSLIISSQAFKILSRMMVTLFLFEFLLSLSTSMWSDTNFEVSITIFSIFAITWSISSCSPSFASCDKIAFQLKYHLHWFEYFLLSYPLFWVLI